MKNKNYNIVKRIKINNSYHDILLIDSHAEIWEIDNKEKAEEIAEILTKNSDSGWVYFIRESNGVQS